MKSSALVLALAVAGCVESEPVISSFNGSSVGIQSPGLIAPTKPTQEEYAKASDTCQSTASYASSRMIGEYTQEHLFICR